MATGVRLGGAMERADDVLRGTSLRIGEDLPDGFVAEPSRGLEIAVAARHARSATGSRDRQGDQIPDAGLGAVTMLPWA